MMGTPRWRTILPALITIGLVTTGCLAVESAQGTSVSVAQAEKLVQAWVKLHRDKHNWHASPKLKEVTTPEVRERLGAQVFELVEPTISIPEVESYLTKDGRVYPMGVGVGGPGLTQMSVADIDGDAKDDFIYVYSWGSGMGRSLVEAYSFGKATPAKIEAGFAAANMDVSVKLKDDGRVDLLYSRSQCSRQSPRLGELTVVQRRSRKVTGIRLDEALPEKVKRDIWRFE